jgi:hypothetical protein
MRHFFLKLLVAAALALPAEAWGQSGWTRAQGSFFGKLDLSQLATGAYYAPTGAALQTNTFRQTSLNFYGEYGWKPRWTLIAALPLLRRNSFEGTEPVLGMGDLRLELKYRLTGDGGRIPVALSIAPELPTGRRNAFSESKAIAGERINLPTGDGEFNLWATLAASRSFGKWYASAFGAYNFRTAYQGLGFRDQYQLGLEGGWNPLRGLWLNTKLRAQFATGESKHPELGFARGDGTTYTLLSAEAFYKVGPRWGIAATYLTGGGWVAPLKNIYAAPYFSVGVVYERP